MAHWKRLWASLTGVMRDGMEMTLFSRASEYFYHFAFLKFHLGLLKVLMIGSFRTMWITEGLCCLCGKSSKTRYDAGLEWSLMTPSTNHEVFLRASGWAEYASLLCIMGKGMIVVRWPLHQFVSIRVWCWVSPLRIVAVETTYVDSWVS